MKTITDYRQLLYYPFTPFFVVFENVANNSTDKSTAEMDLKLLETTTTYFQQMSSQVGKLSAVCAKLEHTAAVFHRLAQTHVYNNLVNTQAAHSMSRSKKRPRQDSASDLFEEIEHTALTDPNVTKLLEWLPMDMDATCRMLEDELQAPTSNQSLGRVDGISVSQGRKQVPDRIFDWFAWDAYYSGAGGTF